jgi:glycosyltransferase involved in cell wall biosynthesis
MTHAKGITGIIPVRNGTSLGYCWQLAVESLLPVCNQVIISDGESSDTTLDEIRAWAEREPKITVHNHKWENPVGDLWFLSRWINAALTLAKFDMQVQLDADEVLDPKSYSMLQYLAAHRKAARFHRINCWGDPWTEAPHGTVCAHNPTRLGPIEHPAVCDNLHPVEPWVNENAEDRLADLRIWHLGFLRDQPQFLAKSRQMQSMLCNTYDPILRKCEETGESWVKNSPFPEDRPLIVHNIKIPDLIKPWLRERGFNIV